MLTVIFGSDVIGVRQRARVLMGESVERGYLPREVSGENYEPGALIDFAGGSSLFGERQALLIDTPSLSGELMEELRGAIEALHASENHTVVIEEALTAELKKEFTAGGAELIECNKDGAKGMNPFALADALALRDRKLLWMLLQDAARDGRPAEELIGTLFWQLKMLRLAARTGSATEAGQKPFVYQKAKRALEKYKPGDLERLSESLVKLYHDGHGGKRDITAALEAWALTL